MIRRWSTWLLSALNITVRQFRSDAVYEQALGDINPQNQQQFLTVANHVSWLDIFVINAVAPMRFVAKADIRDWPLVGPLCAGTGTIFIERNKRTALREAMAMVKQALVVGDRIAIFPEGTTSDMQSILPFHSNFLQVAIDEKLTVLPLAIRFVDPRSGGLCEAALFIGDTNFVQSCMQICGETNVVAELYFTNAIVPDEQSTRQSLGTQSRQQICDALGLGYQVPMA